MQKPMIVNAPKVARPRHVVPLRAAREVARYTPPPSGPPALSRKCALRKPHHPAVFVDVHLHERRRLAQAGHPLHLAGRLQVVSAIWSASGQVSSGAGLSRAVAGFLPFRFPELPRANKSVPWCVFPSMKKLLLLALLGVGAVVAYNYNDGRDLFQLPGGTSAAALKDSVRETVRDTVRDGVRSAARETSAEVKERAKDSVHAVKNRAEDAVTSAALTSKIKAKMALDDAVTASDIDIDTDGGVVTLTGAVESADEQKRALRIATETAGVTKVVNRLKVR
jgi:hypothetical protein